MEARGGGGLSRHGAVLALLAAVGAGGLGGALRAARHFELAREAGRWTAQSLEADAMPAGDRCASHEVTLVGDPTAQDPTAPRLASARIHQPAFDDWLGALLDLVLST